MIRNDHQNGDVFCRINSHFGDIDNDPHTPKSEGSPSSVEKTLRRKQSKRTINPFDDVLI
jgi:hypothetical protein